ncbi:hypothetical protein VNO78_31015 [Psophocarpus tetragonolobus]|uniref:Uncharacterized protein n=1 Tax=Psophocarpus tetragonolobus TaxID=3891 RepID=A0AAN9RZ42_PSOTE
MYSLLLETYIRDSDEKQKLFRVIDTIPCVAKKAQWALRWIESTNSFAERVREIVRDVVDIEREFVCDALPCALVGMNGDLSTLSLSRIGYCGKTNFFEKRVGEYQKASVMSSLNANGICSILVDVKKMFASFGATVRLEGLNSGNSPSACSLSCNIGISYCIGLDELITVKNISSQTILCLYYGYTQNLQQQCACVSLMVVNVLFVSAESTLLVYFKCVPPPWSRFLPLFRYLVVERLNGSYASERNICSFSCEFIVESLMAKFSLARLVAFSRRT